MAGSGHDGLEHRVQVERRAERPTDLPERGELFHRLRVSSSVRAFNSLSSRAFSIAMTAWSAKVLSSAISDSANGPSPGSGDRHLTDRLATTQHRHR